MTNGVNPICIMIRYGQFSKARSELQKIETAADFMTVVGTRRLKWLPKEYKASKIDVSEIPLPMLCIKQAVHFERSEMSEEAQLTFQELLQLAANHGVSVIPTMREARWQLFTEILSITPSILGRFDQIGQSAVLEVLLKAGTPRQFADLFSKDSEDLGSLSKLLEALPTARAIVKKAIQTEAPRFLELAIRSATVTKFNFLIDLGISPVDSEPESNASFYQLLQSTQSARFSLPASGIRLHRRNILEKLTPKQAAELSPRHQEQLGMLITAELRESCGGHVPEPLRQLIDSLTLPETHVLPQYLHLTNQSDDEISMLTIRQKNLLLIDAAISKDYARVKKLVSLGADPIAICPDSAKSGSLKELRGNLCQYAIRSGDAELFHALSLSPIQRRELLINFPGVLSDWSKNREATISKYAKKVSEDSSDRRFAIDEQHLESSTQILEDLVADVGILPVSVSRYFREPLEHFLQYSTVDKDGKLLKKVLELLPLGPIGTYSDLQDNICSSLFYSWRDVGFDPTCFGHLFDHKIVPKASNLDSESSAEIRKAFYQQLVARISLTELLDAYSSHAYELTRHLQQLQKVDEVLPALCQKSIAERRILTRNDVVAPVWMVLLTVAKDPAFVYQLLKKNDVSLQETSADLETICHLAARSRNLDFFRQVANDFPQYVTETSEVHETPLVRAVEANSLDIATHLQQSVPITASEINSIIRILYRGADGQWLSAAHVKFLEDVLNDSTSATSEALNSIALTTIVGKSVDLESSAAKLTRLLGKKFGEAATDDILAVALSEARNSASYAFLLGVYSSISTKPLSAEILTKFSESVDVTRLPQRFGHNNNRQSLAQYLEELHKLGIDHRFLPDAKSLTVAVQELREQAKHAEPGYDFSHLEKILQHFISVKELELDAEASRQLQDSENLSGATAVSRKARV